MSKNDKGSEAAVRKVRRVLSRCLVPKLYLGTQLPEKLHFEIREAQLPEQVRSQVQLGNELAST